MFNIVEVSMLEKSIQSLLLIALILLVRRYFNVKSIKWANIFLWTLLLLYLLTPYGILINIKSFNSYGLSETVLKTFILINEYIKLITIELGSVLSAINRVLGTSLIAIYVIYQVFKMKKALKHSTYAPKDRRIEDCINLFNIKRKIEVLINDDLKAPITYGVLKPKIILKSNILQDDELLKYILIHELTHIKKFDILYSHIKNLITCLYWYNPFIIVASQYIEDDLEILCDKLTIQKVGDTSANRKKYCIAMMQLIEDNTQKFSFGLKMNPCIERMTIMKKWKISLVGVLSFVIIGALSTTVFADVDQTKENIILSDEISTVENTESNAKLTKITYTEKVSVITDKEYDALQLGDSLLLPKPQPYAANIDKTENLSGLSTNQYPFNMKTWTEAKHNAFTIKLSSMSCKSGVDYQIIIQKNGENIYKKHFTGGKNITVENAHNNSKYNVIIQNHSTDALNYKIKINSYIK